MLPDVTNDKTPPAVRSDNEGAFDAYISYCALGGLITEDDGTPSKMTLEDFCTTYGVTRMTLSRWKRQTPDWGERVTKRRDEIAPHARVTAVWNNMYLIARQQKDKRAAVEAGKLFLGHHGLKLPVQRQDVKVEVNSWTALLEKKRDVIEGEVVDDADRLEELYRERDRADAATDQS